MNLLKHCSFIDRHRSNTSIELDDIIEENYQKALQYVNYEQNITSKITEIFKLNNLI